MKRGREKKMKFVNATVVRFVLFSMAIIAFYKGPRRSEGRTMYFGNSERRVSRKQELPPTCVNEKSRLPPRAFFHPHRFDLLVKLLYAQHFVSSNNSDGDGPKVPQFVREAYIEHERAFNNFMEGWKFKPEHFVESFEDTCISIRDNSFLEKFAPLAIRDIPNPYVPKDCLQIWLANAAHRVACAEALSLPILPWHLICENDQCWPHNLRRLWDSDFFLNNGMPRKYADYAFHNFITMNYANIAVVQLFSSGTSQIPQNLERLTKHHFFKNFPIWYHKQVLMSAQAFNRYMKHVAGAKEEISTVSDAGAKVLLVYFLQIDSEKTEERLMKHQYLLKGSGLLSVITKNREDILRISETVLFSSSLGMLERLPEYTTCERLAKRVGNTERRNTNLVLAPESATQLYRRNATKKEEIGAKVLAEPSSTVHTDLLQDPQNYGYCFGLRVPSKRYLSSMVP